MALKLKRQALKVKQVPVDTEEGKFRKLLGDLGKVQSVVRILDSEGEPSTTVFAFFDDLSRSRGIGLPRSNGFLQSKGYCLPYFVLKPARYLLQARKK